MKIHAPQHPKTLALKSALQTSLPTVVGHLELLWHFAAQHAPRGDIGKWSNAAIAGACYWEGDADAFVQALIDSGYADESATHRVVIHDWAEHCPQYVRAALSRRGISFASSDAQKELSLDATEEGSEERSRDPSILTKPNLTKPSPNGDDGAEPKPAPAPAITIPLNDGTDYPIAGALVREWRELYPAVDVMQTLRNLRGWCLANPRRRKTRRGVLRFINAALAKDQDRRPGRSTNGQAGRPSAVARVRAASDDDRRRRGNARPG